MAGSLRRMKICKLEAEKKYFEIFALTADTRDYFQFDFRTSSGFTG